MVLDSKRPLHCLAATLLLLVSVQTSLSDPRIGNGISKSEVFLSPKFVMEPGSVSNKYFYNVDFPKGHIAIKSFNAEVVDEEGNPIPLHETYLHHWIVLRYHQRKDTADIGAHQGDLGFLQSDHIVVKNSGMCDSGLSQYFGLGSETRRTSTDVPDPYGIEVGNPTDVAADGYEERWMLNVHAIDTRGAEDKMGCTECRCDLYNMTVDGGNYNGGLRCCHDGAKCRVEKGFEGGVETSRRSLYLRYTVEYIDWEESIVPVRIYILDVTDIWTKADESRGIVARHRCLIEYNVESCSAGGSHDSCTHTKTLSVSLPTGGDVIYGVGHQHAGGSGTALYGEGGRLICSSNPIYGTGEEPGNEAGYIVGMSTCYPSPGSVKISDGETLTLVSNYSSTQTHTGVMGLFYLLVSDSSPERDNLVQRYPAQENHKSSTKSKFNWGFVLFGVGLVSVVVSALSIAVVSLLRVTSGRRNEGYEPIIA
ncbi:hypothetical protein ABFX02_09G079500 [Erythranthe guttata]